MNNANIKSVGAKVSGNGGKPAPISTKPTCTDSDSGINYAVSGNVYGKLSNGTSYNLYDSCNGNVLKEMYCYSVKSGGKSYSSAAYTCPYSCSNGACINPPSCSDGTFYGVCSKNQPLYCSNGALINNCSYCSCSLTQTCGSDGSCFTVQITSNITINGTSGNDIFQIYNNAVYLNGVNVYTLKQGEVVTLNGLEGNDSFISVGSGTQIINGGIGLDTYWVDSSDIINDALSEENSQNTVHVISQYYQPWSTLPSDPNYINIDSNGKSIKDPAGSGSLINYKSTPLFSTNGVHYYDIRQGQSADCYYMSAMATGALEMPQNVKQAIIQIGDGNYIVRFYRNNQPVYIKLDADLYGSPYYANINNGLWVALLEKAFAYFRSGQNSYSSLDYGWMSEGYTSVFNKGSNNLNPSSSSDSQLYTTFTNVLNNNKLSTEASGSGIFPIVGNHAYASINSSTENSIYFLTVYNPWGFDGYSYDSNSNDGLLKLNITLYKQAFTTLQISP